MLIFGVLKNEHPNAWLNIVHNSNIAKRKKKKQVPKEKKMFQPGYEITPGPFSTVNSNNLLLLRKLSFT